MSANLALSRRRALAGALAALAAPSAALAAQALPAATPTPHAAIADLIARHRAARAEFNEALRALDDLEERLGHEGTRGPRALKYICYPRREGEEGERVYLHTNFEIDDWCDKPRTIPFVLLDEETPEQIRARMHAELDADADRQEAIRQANGYIAAVGRFETTNEAEWAARDAVMETIPATVADALALLAYAAAITDPGLSADSDNPLEAVGRNIVASLSLASEAHL